MSDPFIGEIRMVGFNFAPRGWATCQGQIMAIQQNSALFALLGTNFGAGISNIINLSAAAASGTPSVGRGANLGLAHAMGHSFGALFKQPHGRAVALYLPYSIDPALSVPAFALGRRRHQLLHHVHARPFSPRRPHALRGRAFSSRSVARRTPRALRPRAVGAARLAWADSREQLRPFAHARRQFRPYVALDQSIC